MDRTLLDTDVISELMRGRNLQVRDLASKYVEQYGRLTISTLSVLEIVKGLTKVGQVAKLQAFMQFVDDHEILTLDAEAASIAGRLYAALERNGTPIGRIDPLIAAIAIRQGLSLATGNVEHYERVQNLGFDLRLANWRLP